jgi:hypothetical protein
VCVCVYTILTGERREIPPRSYIVQAPKRPPKLLTVGPPAVSFSSISFSFKFFTFSSSSSVPTSTRMRRGLKHYLVRSNVHLQFYICVRYLKTKKKHVEMRSGRRVDSGGASLICSTFFKRNNKLAYQIYV